MSELESEAEDERNKRRAAEESLLALQVSNLSAVFNPDLAQGVFIVLFRSVRI